VVLRQAPDVAPTGASAQSAANKRAIGRPQQWAPLLPAEHGQLMAQHQQSGVLGELATPVPYQQAQHSREGAIGEGEEHARPCSHRPTPRAARGAFVRGGSQSVAKPATVWYSRARVNL